MLPHESDEHVVRGKPGRGKDHLLSWVSEVSSWSSFLRFDLPSLLFYSDSTVKTKDPSYIQVVECHPAAACS